MPGHHGGGHHGHYGHHGRGRRRFGGYGYGYGGWWPYGYAIPCYRYDEFGNCIDPEIVGMDEHALAGPLALASIPYGVGADPAPSAAPSAPAEGQLVQLSSLLTAPSAVPAKVEMDLQGDQLTVAVQIDGKIYRGTADLSQIFDTAKTYLEAYHEALHRRGTMLVGADGDGCAPSAAQAAEPIAKDVIDRACTLLVGALCDQHRRAHAALCAGFFDDISHAVSSAASGIAHVAEGAVKEAGKTLSKLKGPIATAAAGAAASAAMAIPGAGPLVAPLAGSLANNLVNAAVGGGDVGKAAQRVVRQAKQAAQTNPQIAHALDTAHQAVAQATAGYHTAQTFANAALGDVNAQAQIDQLVAAADAGNANASAVLMVADGAAQQLEANLPDDLAAADAAAVAQPYGDGDAAVQGIIHGGAPKARMLVGASARELASAAAQQFPSRAVGIVQTIDGNWQLQGFPDADAADDWYGSWLSMPHAFAYVAYYDKADPSFPAPLNEEVGHPVARAQAHGASIRRNAATVSGPAQDFALAGLRAGAMDTAWRLLASGTWDPNRGDYAMYTKLSDGGGAAISPDYASALANFEIQRKIPTLEYVALFDFGASSPRLILEDSPLLRGGTSVSGWLGVLAGLGAGVAAGMYGPDAYHWLKGKLASKGHA